MACISCFKCRSCYRNNKNITLLLVGLDNAGKSVTARRLLKEPIHDVVPTCGFNTFTLYYKRCKVTFYDLGGASSIRRIWNFYYSEVHGIVYVVDASDVTRMEECKVALTELLSHNFIKGKPMLLLANKQDKENALEEVDICHLLDLEKLVNDNKCPTRLELCSAIKTNKNGKIDPSIWDGFCWLINIIKSNYIEISVRVQNDVEYLNKNITPKPKRHNPSVSDGLSDKNETDDGNPFVPLKLYNENNIQKVDQKLIESNLITVQPGDNVSSSFKKECINAESVGESSSKVCFEKSSLPCMAGDEENKNDKKKTQGGIFSARRSSKVMPLNDLSRPSSTSNGKPSMLPPLIRTPKKFLDDMNVN